MRTPRRTAGLSALLLTATSIGLLGPAGPAAAALPEPPDNLVLFPNRDFLTVEGFEDRDGDTGIIRVTRGGQLVGYTESPMVAGGVAFEVNHPGGVCWGVGAPNAGLKVTPDLQGGDVVELEVKSNGAKVDATVQSVEVKSESREGAVVTVLSTVPSSIPDDRIEARIIQPDLKDTAVGRRDARAVVGSAGDTGYTSSLERTSDTEVRATYTFEDAETAATALAGTSRIMAWQATSGGERVGITIAEHEELGGPGMGGCPASPADVAQPGASGVVVTPGAGGTSARVDWTAADSVVGAAGVTGYQVTATDAAGSIVGKKVGLVTNTTLTGLTSGTAYTVEVRAAQGDVLSKPAVATEGSGTGGGTGGGDGTGTGSGPVPSDTTAPGGLTAVQGADGKVTLGSNDDSAQIYYTLDGSAVTSGDVPTDDALLYTVPFAITADDTVVKYAAFDRAGNFDVAESGQFDVVTAPPVAPLAAPTGLTATAGPGSVKLDWTAVTGAETYQVAVVDKSATPVAVPQPAATTARTLTVSGLTAGKDYGFTVTALAPDRTSPASSEVTAKPTVVVSKPVITRATWKARDLRIEGTSDVATGSIRFYRANADGAPNTSAPVGGTTPTAITAAAAPETGGTFRLRARDGAAGTANPGRIVGVANDGARTAVFVVTNG